MRIPKSLRAWLTLRAGTIINGRPADFVIGTDESPYLLRWFVIPRNPLFNLYLHKFLRDDDDRALHDHPWFNASILLAGGYREHTIDKGGIHRRRPRNPGDVVIRSPWHAHRIELATPCCYTLFITGPRLRAWGFHCPDAGWVHWKRFTDPTDHGKPGPGCDAEAAP